jgi:hypothetical protein
LGYSLKFKKDLNDGAHALKRFEDQYLKVGDGDVLIKLLTSWTLSIVVFI